MDSNQHGGVSTEQLLSLIGAKEVQIAMLQTQVASLQRELSRLTAELSSSKKPEEAVRG